MKLFGVSLSRTEPAGLHASVVERRAPLAKKHGAPVVLEPSLAAAAGVWDAYGEKYRIGPRR